MLMKIVWIPISWLLQKPADLDLHCFQKMVNNFEKDYAHRALIGSNMVISTIMQEELSVFLPDEENFAKLFI